MQNLSIVILTHNEEENILDCIESLPENFEIIIVDDYSIDRTIDVVKSLKNPNVKIFERKLDDDFSDQRNFGLSKAKGEWVLFIDADERITKPLVDEILSIINNLRQSIINGFFIRRRDTLWGHELKYGETGNIKLLRLAKKDDGKWHGKVHETWEVSGKTETLENVLMHYPHQTVGEFLYEIDKYSTLRAQELFEQKKSISLWEVIIYPKTKFLQNYIFKLGFADGIAGLVIAVMMSLHSFLVRGKLWLKINRLY
jgi:glycosyltransferase involved in cell wall biosynthesis